MVGRKLRILRPLGEDRSGLSQEVLVVMGGDMKHGDLKRDSSAKLTTAMEMMTMGLFWIQQGTRPGLDLESEVRMLVMSCFSRATIWLELEMDALLRM